MIGRAPDNQIVLDDPRASRHHAHIKATDDGSFAIVDGVMVNGQIKRSANHVFVNGEQRFEHPLKDGDRVTIGASTIRFEQLQEERTADLSYDDKPLGHTQLLMSAKDVLSTVLRQAEPVTAAGAPRDKVLESLQRKANILAELYEMSKALGSGFDLDKIFKKATDIIFRSTPADRVIALLAEGIVTEANADEAKLFPIATRARDEKLEAHARKMTIGRTITRKVMKDKVALLSQDAAADEQFAGVDSIVSQGVRSTICAPNYGRFLPEYVVKQLLENPDSFKLGGVTQTITVLFADIRGFTSISEHAAPEKIVHLLNMYFSAMTDIIFAHGGTLDKYLGDGLMALFGAPTVTAKDAQNAINAAVAMQRRMLSINDELHKEGLPEIGIGIGLHTGEVTVGYIGSERRSEYTAIGDAVNTSSRLESNAKRGEILVSEVTAKAAKSRYQLTARDPINVKNREQPVPLFEVDWQHATSS